MIDFLILVGVAVAAFYVGWGAGWKGRERRAVQVLHHYQQMMEEQQPQYERVEIRVERVDDMFYVYKAESGEFLAQGRDHAEIEQKLKARFTNTLFVASPDHLKEIGYVK